jgi:hypothetical protein
MESGEIIHHYHLLKKQFDSFFTTAIFLTEAGKKDFTKAVLATTSDQRSRLM